MDFDPVNSEHAIQTVGFILLFDGPFQSETIQALRSREDLLADLPAVQTPEAVQLEVGPSPTTRRVQGIQLSHLRPDGTPAWALRLFGNELAVECTRYTRWDRVWAAAQKYLQAGLQVAAHGADPRKLLVIGQVFIDAFLANREDYDLGNLLKRGPFVAEKVFSAGPTWHNHVGWFEWSEAYGLRSPCLNQLNIDALRPQEPSNKGLRINISHNQEVRLQKPVPIEEGKSELDRLMNTLHMNNKKMVNGLLTPQMAARIGLEDRNVATSS